MRRLLFTALLCTSFFASSEETISRWMSDYFKRIHDHIGNENYEKAEYELEMGNNNYFRGCLLYTS